MNETKRSTKLPFTQVRSIKEIINMIPLLISQRKMASFGVKKEDGVSIERTRRLANQAAIDLLNSLPPDFDGRQLSQEQRDILAAYTGMGGLGNGKQSDLGIADSESGGGEFEYYTPPELAQGMWDALAINGFDGGSVLEPTASTGVFQETKSRGVIVTAAEIDKTSGKINQLLHPEDAVSVSPFEAVAISTPDDSFDGFVGNVPFGISRGIEQDLDPAYKNIKEVGAYVLLRAIDKLKPNALGAVIVPTGMTDGKKFQKLRTLVSKKAEFLGAHRMPSGTFSENGTDVVTDVWIIKKHPMDLAERIKSGDLDENTQKETLVLWETFLRGKWFALDGRKFVYGDIEVVGTKGFKRLVVKNNQIKGNMRQKLSVKFDSRIDWEALALVEQKASSMQDGDKRFVDGVWYVMQGGVLIPDESIMTSDLDNKKYGVSAFAQISSLFQSPQSVLKTDFTQLQNLFNDYGESVPSQYHSFMQFAMTQKPALREKAFRGSVIGAQILTLQDKLALYPDADFDDERAALMAMVNNELLMGFNPNEGQKVSVSASGAKNWLTFKNSVTKKGELSEFLRGEVEFQVHSELDTTDAEAVLRNMFSQILLDPISVSDFRKVYSGSLPDNDIDALSALAQIEGIAITPDGYLLPMDRATSGNVAMLLERITRGLTTFDSEVIKDNLKKQLELVQQKRKYTKPEDIDFSMTDRWFDRRLILEFLQENGYDDLVYIEEASVEDGKLVSNTDYSGRDGVFTGYRYKTVNSKNKETGATELVYKRVRNTDAFADQLENYLNGTKPKGIYAADYMERIDRLNESFNNWLRQRDEFDNLVDEYNVAFNAYVEYQHDDSNLGLKDVSGRMIPFGYQNAEIRRLSEDGRGIMGFGTGLGKTVTANALEAFNYENGRCKRTAFVVPKSVIGNWYNEQRAFYSESAFSQFLFIGLDPILDGQGVPVMIPVLDDSGQPKINKHTGEPELVVATREVSAEVIKERLNAIPQSNYRAVVMTKEQYASIPLRPETLESRAQDILYSMAEADRVNLDGQKHRDAQKKNKIRSDATNTGTSKSQEIPYFEDMGFDNVIVDEAHNYRNSFATGRESSQLAYLPNSIVAKSARDMAVKNAYLMEKNSGKGAYLLSATPLVNSPVDAFNMLSHVVPYEEWNRLGIYTPDDFVKTFGEISTANVMKISGEIETKQALVGFKNLSGLRGIFNRYTTIKDITDVSSEVQIPETVSITDEVPLTEYQEAEYATLRERAKALSEGKKEGEDAEKEDSIFSIIRDMDRLVIDPDMYHKRMTFLFPISQFNDVDSLVADIALNVDDVIKGKGDKAQVLAADPQVERMGKFAVLTIQETFENEVIKRLSSYDLSEKDFTHPVSPKYAKLISNLKERSSRGKQIIFFDEKTQHEKLRRILAHELGVDKSEIGILNADTVAQVARDNNASRIRPVPEPALPPEDATDKQLQSYFEKKAKYDEYIGSLSDIEAGGMEKIAADYQEGRTKYIICNKKAEVGINLHNGTVAVHHLNIPWTPASVKQRDGRAARVGSKEKQVESIFYSGKGSFDEFRIETVQRKKNWITEIMRSDVARIDNTDANSSNEMQMMLAENPQQRAQMLRDFEAKKENEERQKGIVKAGNDLMNYLKMAHASQTPISAAERNIELANEQISKAERELTTIDNDLVRFNREMEELIASRTEKEARGDTTTYIETGGIKRRNSEIKAITQRRREVNQELSTGRKALNAANNFKARIEKSSSAVKRLKGEVEHAIKAGYLTDVDESVLVNPAGYWKVGKETYKVGQYYEYRIKSGYNSADAVGRLDKIDIENGLLSLTTVWLSPYAGKALDDYTRQATVSFDDIGKVTDRAISQLELETQLLAGVSLQQIADGLLTKEQFSQMAKDGTLMLTGSYTVIAEDGEYKPYSFYSRDWSEKRRNITRKAESLVYPDPSDKHLKESIAATVLKDSSSYTQTNLAPFLAAIFGTDYINSMKEYLETASPAKVKTLVAEFIAEKVSAFEKTALANTFNIDGTGINQVKAYITGRSHGRSGGMFTQKNNPVNTREFLQRIFGDDLELQGFNGYSNTSDFSDEFRNQVTALLTSISDNTANAAKAYALKALQEYKVLRGSPTTKAEDILAKFKEWSGDDYLEIYANSESLSAYYLPQFFSDAVTIGAIDAKAITEQSFYDSGRLSAQRIEIESAIVGLIKANNVRLLEELKASKEGDITQITDDALQGEILLNRLAESVTFGDIEVKINATELRVKGGSFDSGACWCLNDPNAFKGKLYKAKNELKAKYNAKYFSSKKSSDELQGSWWLIPVTYDLGEIKATIEQY